MTDPSEPLSVSVSFELSAVSEHAGNLYRDGYPREAVRHEAERLLRRIQAVLQRPDLDGQSLIQNAFNEGNPALTINERGTPLDHDEHAGFLYLTLGVTRGIRNVFTHDIEADVSVEDGAMWLWLLNRLHRQFDHAEAVAASQDESRPASSPD